MLFTETNAVFKRQVADLLIACPIGGRVTFDQISRAVGFDIRTKRHVIDAARRMASREVGAIFVSVIGEGYDRLPGDKADSLGRPTRAHVRKTVNRAAELMVNAVTKANDISDAARIRVNREQSMLGLISYLSQDRSVHPAKDGAAPPPSAATIRASIEALKGG